LIKVKKNIVRGILALIAVLIVLWIGISLYLFYNKNGLIEKVKSQINQQIKGNVEITDLSAAFFSTFPLLSIQLSGVSIRDSLWHQHKNDFINAESIYIQISLPSLLTGQIKPGKVIVENASLYLFIDSTGYSNLVRTDDPATPKGERHVPDLLLKNTRVTMENIGRNKLHDILFERMDCKIEEKDSLNLLHINMKSLVHGITFNTAKGSYLKNKRLDGKFTARVREGILSLPNIRLNIDRHPFNLNGKFYLKNDPRFFYLTINTNNIRFNKISEILTRTISSKLDSFKISEPVNLKAEITGEMGYRYVPLVKVNMDVKNATVTSPTIELNESTFAALFTNEIVNNVARTDENSLIKITGFEGKWGDIAISSDNISITNLKQPFLECDLRSDFNLVDINSITESETIRFDRGSGKINIRYKGSIATDDTIAPVMNGNINFSNANITYLPRDFTLTNGNGQLLFKHHDLFIPYLNASAGNTKLKMKGDVQHFLAMLNVSPESLELNWQATTEYLNVQDFLNFIGSNKASSKRAAKSSKNSLGKATANIDRMLKDGVANIKLNAANVLYKKFKATDVNANVRMITNQMILQNANLHHAGGHMNFSGSLTEQGSTSQLAFKSDLDNIDIPGIFYAFNNFEQDAITQNNMKGKLNALVNINGALTNAADIVENSLKGTVKFSVKEGELNNFEPVMKIGEVAFKNRDFSKVRFAELKSTLEINGSAIALDRMEIRSNVIKLFVEGVYDPKNKTDMSIQVPISNLSKDDSEELQNKGRAGANIRLRAQTGDDGNLKISWDPFNKAGKEREKVMDENKKK
jgi:hypothetical protein